MPKITPNLWFDTEAEEAAAFYVSVFKREARLARAGLTSVAPKAAACSSGDGHGTGYGVH